jgi:Leucine-rich repeat (LRR) protein
VRLSLSSNRLSTLPAELFNLTGLVALSLEFNRLTTLPVEIASLTDLRSLSVGANDLRALPSELSQLTALESLSVFMCNLSSLPASIGNLRVLSFLDLSNNSLSALPDSFFSLPKLATLLAPSDRFASLPAAIGQMRNLTTIDLEDNLLSELPEALGELSNLESLLLARNRLSALPLSLASPSLRTLTLSTLPTSFNQLALPIVDLPLNQFDSFSFDWLSQSVLRLNISWNRVATLNGGCFCPSLVAVDMTGDPLQDKNACSILSIIASSAGTRFLSSLGLARTGVEFASATAIAFCPPLFSLLALDLSDNNLTALDLGSLALSMQPRSDAVVRLSGNPMLRLSPADLVVQDSRRMPPLYFSAEGMLCNEAWSPFEQRCLAPRFALGAVQFSSRVEEYATLVSVSEGFFPALASSVPFVDAPRWRPGDLRLLRCHIPSACNPSAGAEPPLFSSPSRGVQFSCASGRDPRSLLCSRCAAGHYAIGAQCHACAPGTGVVVVLFSLLAAAAVVAISWSATAANQHGAAATNTYAICFFFLQLNEALEQTLPPAANSSVLSATPSLLLGMFYFRPFAIECVSHDADAVAALWLWFVIVALIPCVCAALYLVTRRLQPGPRLGQRALACAWSLSSLVYLPVAQAALAAFNREQPEPGVAAYVSSAPHLEWWSARHREMVGVAVALLLCFVLPVPVLAFRRASASLSAGGAESDPAAAFIREWRLYWWWRLVVIDGRPLAVAALVALLPWRSEWMSVSHFVLLVFFYSATLIA